MKTTCNFKTIRPAVITCLFMLISFTTASCQVDNESAHKKAAVPQVSPDMRNLSLQMEDLAGKPVRLINGRFQGDHLSVSVLKTATADLDQDGLTDGVIIIFENSGGSGNFRTLCLLMNNGKKMVHTDEKFIGDRIRITSLKIDAGTIIVDYLDRSPDESFAVEPHIRKRVNYRVRGIKLERIPSGRDS